jgi:peptidoglycan/xylan/chitin deacetylase (PgdA/CDA1 family)
MPASWTVVEVVPWHSDILFPSVAKQMISSIYVGSDVLADDVSGDPLAHFLLYLIRRCSREINVPDAMRADEAASRRLLQDIIGREVKHFAYAFGACGPREAQIAKRLGFRTAVTLQHGTLFSQHANHLHELPREPLDRTDTSSSLRCKLAGIYRAYYSNFGEPVAHL